MTKLKNEANYYKNLIEHVDNDYRIVKVETITELDKNQARVINETGLATYY